MRKILIAAASVLAMSFAGAAAQAEDTLKIGLQSAMTGWGAAWGVPLAGDVGDVRRRDQ